MDNSTKIGVITGTGAAVNVSLGFVPDYVQIVNATDGDRIDTWFEGMANGTAVTVGAGTTATATNGISPYAGDANNARGFTVGTAISEAGKTLYYLAIRTSSGK